MYSMINVPIDSEIIPEIYFPTGDPFRLALRYKNIYISWAHLEQLPDLNVFINHIETLPDYQRQGWASKIVGMLQAKNDKIETNVYSISQDSAKMLLKSGFEYKKPLFKNEPAKMVWNKKLNEKEM